MTAAETREEIEDALLRLPAIYRTAVVLHDIELAVRCCARLIVMNAGRIALDADAAVAARDPRLDAAFNIRFQRVPIDPSLGPLLPMASPGPATAARKRARQSDA